MPISLIRSVQTRARGEVTYYCWHRQSGEIYGPEVFSGILIPKEDLS
jgi:hypothetical protein